MADQEKNRKSSIYFSGNRAGAGCSDLLLPVSRIAQALMASFPRGACDKRVDYCLLLYELDQRENCFRFIYDELSVTAFCCGNQCKRILRLYAAPCFYFILVGISENQVS